MGDTLVGQGVEQGFGNVLLPHELGQRLRPPFAIKYLRSHIRPYYTLKHSFSQTIFLGVLEGTCLMIHSLPPVPLSLILNLNPYFFNIQGEFIQKGLAPLSMREHYTLIRFSFKAIMSGVK
jgi:hypothetical protein